MEEVIEKCRSDQTRLESQIKALKREVAELKKIVATFVTVPAFNVIRQDQNAQFSTLEQHEKQLMDLNRILVNQEDRNRLENEELKNSVQQLKDDYWKIRAWIDDNTPNRSSITQSEEEEVPQEIGSNDAISLEKIIGFVSKIAENVRPEHFQVLSAALNGRNCSPDKSSGQD